MNRVSMPVILLTKLTMTTFTVLLIKINSGNLHFKTKVKKEKKKKSNYAQWLPVLSSCKHFECNVHSSYPKLPQHIEISLPLMLLDNI